MFTSKSIFLLISIILLLAIAWNTDITMVYILFVIAFVMFLISFLHIEYSIPKITLRREVQDTAYEDDMINVKMDIQNKRSISMHLFEIIDRFSGAAPNEKETPVFILRMAGRENTRISYIINSYRRGLWRFGPVSIIFQDALGFFKMKKTLNIFDEILVYPNLFRIFSFPSLESGSISWMGIETAKISGDSHEFFGIREYQKGDAISRIHWPSTARHSRLIVKQFERNAVQVATIVFDLNRKRNIGTGKETTLEYSVKMVGSIARYLLNEGAILQLIGYGKEPTIVPPGKGEAHLSKILEYLARVEADGEFSLSQSLQEASFITPYHSTLITIMQDNDMESLTSLVQFKIKGIKLIVIVLSSSTFGQVEESEYLDAEGAKKFDEALAGLEAYVYRISKGDDLEKKFELV